MSMLKGVSLSIFLAGCLALYLAILMLINPIIPGASSFVDERVAYSVTILILALICCVVAGLTWSRASGTRPGVAVFTSLSLWTILLVAVFMVLGVGDKLPL